jgi:predicted NBD/HSP70 family sugar kinase
MMPSHAAALVPPAPEASNWLRPRGSNQSGMGQFNERVVLQAIRLHGSLAKAELARLTHLSTQTVSIIINRLLEQGLVIKGAPQKGKVGQPSVPIMLNPDGAYFIGIKIGRRSLDLLLIDFLGAVRARRAITYRFPDPSLLFGQIATLQRGLLEPLGAQQAARLVGIGVAAPLGLGGWQTLLGSAPQQAGQWDRLDIRAEIEAVSEVPVVFAKDTMAACVAELVAGRGRSIGSYLYIFVGTFIGGGLVLDSSVHAGLQGNAGALGSMPLHLAGSVGAGAPPEQLLSTASLFSLEQLYLAAGLDDSAAYDARAMEQPWLTHTQAWLEDAAPAIALAVSNGTCLLDLNEVVLDGSAHPALLARLMEETRQALARYSWEGVQPPLLRGGAIGADARAIGAALLPLHANFAPDRELFLKLLHAAAP